MKRFSIWLLIVMLFVTFWPMATSAQETQEEATPFVVESAVVKNDIKTIVAEVNKKANVYFSKQAIQEMFPDWTDEEIVNFVELLQLNARDMDVTQIMVKQYGPQSEAFPTTRYLVERGVEPSALFPINAIGLYLATKHMKQRRIIFIAGSILEFIFLEGHRREGRPYGAPLCNNLTVTVFRARF